MVKTNTDFRGFSALLEHSKTLVYANKSNSKKTLVFFYYAGHGILKGHTKAVCNQGDVPRKIFYPLEGNLRALGAVPGAYVVGVFDCCRAAFEQPDRGTGVQAAPELDTDEARNCILIFGCPPLGTVSAVSTVALEFIEKL